MFTYISPPPPPAPPPLAEKFEQWFKAILRFAVVGAVFVLIVWAICNHREVDEFLHRIIDTGGTLEVASLKISVDVRTGSGARSGVPGAVISVSSIDGPLRIERIHPEFADGVEFVEVSARRAVNLRSAYIGDGDEILQLADDPKLELKRGERLRIYTYYGRKNEIVDECGGSRATACMSPEEHLETWEPVCREVLKPMMSEKERKLVSTDFFEVPKKVLEGFEPNWWNSDHVLNWTMQGVEADACAYLFNEMLYRKLYRRALGSIPGDVAPLPRRLDVSGSVQRQIGAYSEPWNENEEGEILEEKSEGIKSVVAYCLATDPVKGESKEHTPYDSKNQNPIECIEGLPRFRGLFKNEPGEGDRIVMFDGDRRAIADVSYWWPSWGGDERQ